MNDTFNINRLRLLARRQWTENKKVYLLFWGVISAVLLFLSVLSIRYEMYLAYILLFCAGGCAMASTSFSRWTDFARSSVYLLLPASITEKLICSLIFGVILFIPAYCLNYIIIRLVFTFLFHLLFLTDYFPLSEVVPAVIKEISSYPFSYIAVVFLSFLFLQSVYMIIIVKVKKQHMLTLVLVIMAILLLYNFSIHILMSGMVHQKGSVRTPGPFLTYFSADFGYRPLHNPTEFEYFSFNQLIWKLNDLIWFLIFFMLYLTSGIKLKEREL